MQQRYTFQSRPQDIPDNWVIHNAPRPLWGHKEWTGDFLSGVFYVAIDPQGDRTQEMTDHNTQMDAKEVVYVDGELMDQIVADSVRWYKEVYGSEVEIDPQDEEHRDMMFRSWVKRQQEKQDV